MMPVKRIANSSAENPNLLPSSNDKRLMACICKISSTAFSKDHRVLFIGNEDVYHLKWMHLHRGEAKRCYCGMFNKLPLSSSIVFFSIGHWFKLTERQYVDLSDFSITEEMQKPAAH